MTVHGYPISYGDQGPRYAGKFIKTKKFKVLLIVIIPSIVILSRPKLAMAQDIPELIARAQAICTAQNSTAILENTQQLCTAFDASCPVPIPKKGLIPKSSISCMIMGGCIEHARANFAAGNIPAAVTFVCTAATIACADYVAKQNGINLF